MNQQKIFNFNLQNNYGNDDFFVSKSNELAHKILLNIINPEKYIYLKGPSKSGKTHIGHLWININDAIMFNHSDYDVIIDQKKNVFIDSFTLDLDEEKLFHLINHCYNNNLKILITGEIFPSDYKFKINDLSSRIKSFNILQIMDPDDELLKNLLMKLLYDKQRQVVVEQLQSEINDSLFF